jgi:hypothetical protein
VCRPGTGIYNFALLPDSAVLSSATANSIPGTQNGDGARGGIKCDWTIPQPTNIPDSHTRTCAAVLPDGRRWLVGAQLPKVLSV